MDTFSTEQRSWVMRQVKGKNTKPERVVRKILWDAGYRYRLNVKSLPGTPDIAIKKLKKVIFVNGCFWHGHKNCSKAKIPKTRIEYWQAKIARNIERDKQNIQNLEQLGYDVLVVWECEIKRKSIDMLTSKLIDFMIK
ncbi:very short patch repair endonuclease [Sulfurimonas sp. HSL-1716]|uniref:very short patch repair endonuclease n=1 Tax=Hydrocurvibacter sulfurireducens TaxID=3131937 RepID=UPI0031F93124